MFVFQVNYPFLALIPVAFASRITRHYLCAILYDLTVVYLSLYWAVILYFGYTFKT